MGSLGVVAVVLLVLVLLVAAVLNLMTRRRRRSAPGQPRTVADLVRMRGGAEVTDSDRPDDDDAVEAAPSADDLERVPVAVPRQATGPGPDRTLKAATAERGHVPAAGGVASLLPGESGDEGGLAVDLPWVRAARMTESDGVTVPAARSAPDETGTLAVTGRSTGDTGHGARVPLDEPTAAPRPMVGGAHLPPAPAESAVAESAVVDPRGRRVRGRRAPGRRTRGRRAGGRRPRGR